MENIFENFTVTILKLNKLVHRIKTIEMREYGLKTIHVMCVYYLSCNSEGLTATELVKQTLEDKAAISRALKGLRNNGYVTYDEKGYNARILLTESGKKLADDINGKAERAVNAGSAEFSEEQRIFFYRSLSAIAANLEEYLKKLNGENIND